MKQICKLWIWITTIAVMLIIFKLSSAIGEQSSKFTLQITEQIAKHIVFIMGKDVDNVNYLTNIAMWDNLVRKAGHVIEYALMAITINISFSFYHIRKWKSLFLCFGTCFVFACSDEIHQLFIAGRTGQLTDIIIDLVGIVLGITFFYIAKYIFQFIVNIEHKPDKDKAE
jgi:VanZ family protein